jgi:hypothetical protein
MAGFSVLDAMERFHHILKAVVYISAVLLPSGKSFANSPSFCEMVCLLHQVSLSLSISTSLHYQNLQCSLRKKHKLSKPLRPQHQLFTELQNHLDHPASIVCFQIVLPDPQVAVYILF